MANYPKYIPDTPHSEDFFKIHGKIAEMLKQTIESENVSEQSFTFGLLGAWGSGKSLTINHLKKDISTSNDILYFEFDIWKYFDSSLYRSILIDLENKLIELADTGRVDAKYKAGISPPNEETKLLQALYKNIQSPSPNNNKSKDRYNDRIDKLRKGKWFKRPLAWILLGFRPLRTVFQFFKKRYDLLLFIGLIIIIYSLIYYYRSNFEMWFPILKNEYFRPIAKFIAISVFGLSAVELIKESYKELFREMIPKTNNNIVYASPPTFAQDQFEAIFKTVISEISDGGKKKIVIVFDNIDRCEPNTTIQILTGLKTFLDQKNCFYIIPCDDNRIREHIKQSKDEDYLDKIFQAYLRIPVIEGEDKITFIDKCIEKAEFRISPQDKLKISQILTLAYRAETPRQIKRFFNDFISYYRLALLIDPEKKLLLKDLGLFTFMIAIKQKWNSLESIILRQPNLFQDIGTEATKELNIDPACISFIYNCTSWVDHSIDPSIFVYLKDSKNSSTKIQNILLDNDNNFTLSFPIIEQINSYIKDLHSKNLLILVETATEKLKQILETKKRETKEEVLIEGFKIYFDALSWQCITDYEDKSGALILKHVDFICENISVVKNLNINRIPIVERTICNLIKSTGSNETTLKLYKLIVGQFNIDHLKLIFANIEPSQYSKIQDFALNTPEILLGKIFDFHLLRRLAEEANFHKNETQIIDLIKKLEDCEQCQAVKKIISSRVNSALAAVHNQPNVHPFDKHIINGLKILTNNDWEETVRPSIQGHLVTRVSILFQHGQTDMAIEYIIEGLRSQINNLNHSIRQFGNKNIYNKFIDKIDQQALEIAINTDQYREEILRFSWSHNNIDSILIKLGLDYLINNTEKLIFDHPLLINGLLKFSKNNNSNTFENKILKEYQNKIPNLLTQESVNIIPNIIISENRDNLIEKSINELMQKPIPNIVSLTKLFTELNPTNLDSISKIYEVNKMTLVNLDNPEIFSELIKKLPNESKEDYIKRILENILSKLKAATSSSLLVKIEQEFSSEQFKHYKDKIIEIINELLEISRDVAQVEMGINLYMKVNEVSKISSYLIKEQAKKLSETSGKFDSIKEKLKPLL